MNVYFRGDGPGKCTEDGAGDLSHGRQRRVNGEKWLAHPDKIVFYVIDCQYCGKVFSEQTSGKPLSVKQSDDWWDCYRFYLTTPEWAARRASVLARDPICKACGIDPSTQAHHLTYKHVFDEPLFDLIGVCAGCHDRITKRDRAYQKGVHQW